VYPLGTKADQWRCPKAMKRVGYLLEQLGRVVEIWRYPVSSVGGERVGSATLSAMGVAGDRQFGLIDAATGKPAAPEKDYRWRKALHLAARSVPDELPEIVFPGGHSFRLGEASLSGVLSEYFGFATGVATYAHIGRGCFPITHHRHQHFPAHLLTTTSLQHLANIGNVEMIDSRRFRPTVLIEVNGGRGFVEQEWIGRRLRLGQINLCAQEETKRCGMTFISQPGVDEDPEILRNILRHNKRNLGIYCSVNGAGEIHIGDDVFIEGGPRRETPCRD
jgi:uncharacterized protein YcbX